MKKIINFLVFLFLIFVLVFMLSMPKEVIESVSFSLDIWIHNLFPSLFPFLILSSFLNNYGISIILSEIIKPFVEVVLHVNGKYGYTVLMSMFSGFPSSSKFIKDLLDHDAISIDSAMHLLSFCHFSSPLFVIGTIGFLLCNTKLGILILICHYLGAFLTSFFFRSREKFSYSRFDLVKAFRQMNDKIKNSESFTSVLTHAINDSCNTMFLLLGIITVFLIISTIIFNVFHFSSSSSILISGILEMTQGIKSASMSNLAIKKQAFLMLSFISFGGISVHTQVFSILNGYNISYFKYLLARILHVAFSCLILYLAFIIC